MSARDLHFVVMLGSLRQGSYARAIADTLDELAPDDVGVTQLESVGALPHYNEDLARRGFPAAVLAMGDAVAEADAVVIVTPEHNRSIPAALKGALDWMSRLPLRPLAAKPVAIQAASLAPLGGVHVHSHLREVLASAEALVLDEPRVIVPRVASKVDASTAMLRDDATRACLGRQLLALARLVRERAPRPA